MSAFPSGRQASCGVDFAIAYYGTNIQDFLVHAARIVCPTVLHIGGKGPHDPTRNGRPDSRCAANPNVMPNVYKDAPHAFCNIDRADTFRRACSRGACAQLRAHRVRARRNDCQPFTRFLDDGRICLTNNAAERALRRVALGRRNWTFCGSDRGGERAAAIYSLIATAKLNDIDPKPGSPACSAASTITPHRSSMNSCRGTGARQPSIPLPPEGQLPAALAGCAQYTPTRVNSKKSRTPATTRLEMMIGLSSSRGETWVSRHRLRSHVPRAGAARGTETRRTVGWEVTRQPLATIPAPSPPWS